MNIKIKDFRLVPSVNAPIKFDLQKSIIRTREKDNSKYEDWEDHGYGMTLEHCIETIICTILADREEVVSLREYVEAYKKERDVVLNLLK